MNGASRADGFELLRSEMVERLRSHYHITDDRVLDVMNALPRQLFVPEALRSQSYRDNALPISAGQTISQPFIVARMTELLGLTGREKVLEIGSGTGYQTAVLASLAGHVYSIERIEGLYNDARRRLADLGLRNLTLRCGDGTKGWPAYAPYDAILVAAGGPEIPQPLVEQLAVGGRLVVPVGPDKRSQVLMRVRRTDSGAVAEKCGACAFVPLVGEHGWSE